MQSQKQTYLGTKTDSSDKPIDNRMGRIGSLSLAKTSEIRRHPCTCAIELKQNENESFAINIKLLTENPLLTCTTSQETGRG